MFKFEEIDKTVLIPELPSPTRGKPADCPVSGCFPPNGFGGQVCYRGPRKDLIGDPVEMHPRLP